MRRENYLMPEDLPYIILLSIKIPER